MNAKKSKKSRGFTLVELLTVVTIMVILAGMTVGALGWVQRKAAVDKAVTQMKLLEAGLEQFHADTGVYPRGRGKKGLAMYYALFGDGVGPDGIRDTDDDGPLDGIPDEGATVYIPELDPNGDSGMVEVGSNGAASGLLDPFGNYWQYNGGEDFKNRRNNPDFDIYSQGPNGEGDPDEPDADDIKNW